MIQCHQVDINRGKCNLSSSATKKQHHQLLSLQIRMVRKPMGNGWDKVVIKEATWCRMQPLFCFLHSVDVGIPTPNGRQRKLYREVYFPFLSCFVYTQSNCWQCGQRKGHCPWNWTQGLLCVAVGKVSSYFKAFHWRSFIALFSVLEL